MLAEDNAEQRHGSKIANIVNSTLDTPCATHKENTCLLDSIEIKNHSLLKTAIKSKPWPGRH